MFFSAFVFLSFACVVSACGWVVCRFISIVMRRPPAAVGDVEMVMAWCLKVTITLYVLLMSVRFICSLH